MAELTREQVLAMTAGEEMNRIVAQHVLGYCRAAFGRLSKCKAGAKLVPAECSYLIPPDSPALGTEQWAKPNSDLPLSDVPHVPSFSTDIAAAWEVVECLRAQWRTDDPGGLFWRFTDCNQGWWGVSVMWEHHDGDIDMDTILAPTFPLAVCQCALLRAIAEAA